MTDRSQLAQLKDRIEKASGGDRKIDVAIFRDVYLARFPGMIVRGYRSDRERGGYEWDEEREEYIYWAGHNSGGVYGTEPRYTASLDAALSLVEKILPDSDVDLEIRPGMMNGRVHQSTDATIYGHIHGPDEGKSWRGYAATPALAILVALLKAMEASHERG